MRSKGDKSKTMVGKNNFYDLLGPAWIRQLWRSGLRASISAIPGNIFQRF